MVSRRGILHLFGLGIASLLELAGCAPPRSLPTPLAGSLPTAPPPGVPTHPALSPTPSDTPTLTATPSATVTASPTPSATATRRPTHTPTHTPIPSDTPQPTDAPAVSAAPPAADPPTPTPVPTAKPSPTLIPTPIIAPPELIARAAWHARPPSGPGNRHTPARITLHQDGQYFTERDDPVLRMQAIQRFAMDSRGWIDIPYHFVIDREGLIYEGRTVDIEGDTATDYDATGHVSLTLMGDYDSQYPTPAQLEALVELAVWLVAAYAIPPEMISGHRDHAVTTCPGNHVYDAYLASGLLTERVREQTQ